MKESGCRVDTKDVIRLSAFSAAVVSDLTITNYALHTGFVELNPITARAVDGLGVDSATDLIGALTIAAGSSIYLLSKKFDKKFEDRKIGVKNILLAGTVLEAVVSVSGLIKIIT